MQRNSVYHPRALQLLWGKWELPRHTEFLEIPEILFLPHLESPSPEAFHEVR